MRQQRHYVYWYHLKEHSNIRTEGYVGVTKDLVTRDACHKKYNNGFGVVLRKAFAKYGNSIEKTLICCTNKIAAYRIEKDLRPTEKIGWNLAIGGGLPPDCTGNKHSIETKRKIAQAHRGISKPNKTKGMVNRYTLEQRAHIGSFHKGKIITEQHKQTIRQKLSGANNRYAKSIHFVHTDNLDKVISFGSLGDAAKAFNVGYSGVRAMYQRIQKSGSASNPNVKGWCCIHENHLSDPRETVLAAMQASHIARSKGKRASGKGCPCSIPITLENKEGHIETYPSTLQAANAIGMSDATLRYHIQQTLKLTRDSSFTKSGWKVKYKGEV